MSNAVSRVDATQHAMWHIKDESLQVINFTGTITKLKTIKKIYKTQKIASNI